MKGLFIAVLVVLLFSHCEKTPGDLSGEKYINGRLFLYDSITQQAMGQPLGKKKVTISYADQEDTLNYLFSVTTDEEGYFDFKNLNENTRYRISYEEKIGDVTFIARDTIPVTESVDEFILRAYVASDK